VESRVQSAIDLLVDVVIEGCEWARVCCPTTTKKSKGDPPCELSRREKTQTTTLARALPHLLGTN
jgi:hypothetical protein